MNKLLVLALLFSGQALASEPARKPLDLSRFTVDEVVVYNYGEISRTSRVAGGILGTVVGFGMGHLVYGQYDNRGWIFTVGEAVTGLMYFDAPSGSIASYLMLGGLAAFKIWEIFDVWTLPGRHNARYRDIKGRMDGPPPAAFRLTPMVTANAGAPPAGGLQLGLTF